MVKDNCDAINESHSMRAEFEYIIMLDTHNIVKNAEKAMILVLCEDLFSFSHHSFLLRGCQLLTASAFCDFNKVSERFEIPKAILNKVLRLSAVNSVARIFPVDGGARGLAVLRGHTFSFVRLVNIKHDPYFRDEGFNFHYNGPECRLDPTDAIFVDVIHTDGNDITGAGQMLEVEIKNYSFRFRPCCIWVEPAAPEGGGGRGRCPPYDFFFVCLSARTSFMYVDDNNTPTPL